MRRFFACFLACAALVCGGCTQRAAQPGQNPVLDGLRDAARGIAAGRAFDDALLAARREDDAALENAIERLDRSGAPKVAWLAVAQSLNNIGYPLAENGRSLKDFVRAEELTRRSLAYWDKIIAAQPAKSEGTPLLRFNRELTAHDSLAWALYRQGRLNEALREQKSAVEAAVAVAPKTLGARFGLADMYYHLGKIHQALKHQTQAQSAFAEALKLRPDHPEANREIQVAPDAPAMLPVSAGNFQ